MSYLYQSGALQGLGQQSDPGLGTPTKCSYKRKVNMLYPSLVAKSEKE